MSCGTVYQAAAMLTAKTVNTLKSFILYGLIYSIST